MAQTKGADGKPQVEAVGKPQKRVADNKAVSKPVTDEEVAGWSNASDTRHSQWMDAAPETVMNIIDEEYSMGIETKRAGIGYDFPESPGALELLRADRRWCYFKL